MTPALIQKTAQEYLRPENRTVLVIQPGAHLRRRRAAAKPAGDSEKKAMMERTMTPTRMMKLFLAQRNAGLLPASTGVCARRAPARYAKTNAAGGQRAETFQCSRA